MSNILSPAPYTNKNGVFSFHAENCMKYSTITNFELLVQKEKIMEYKDER